MSKVAAKALKMNIFNKNCDIFFEKTYLCHVIFTNILLTPV